MLQAAWSRWHTATCLASPSTAWTGAPTRRACLCAVHMTSVCAWALQPNSTNCNVASVLIRGMHGLICRGKGSQTDDIKKVLPQQTQLQVSVQCSLFSCVLYTRSLLVQSSTPTDRSCNCSRSATIASYAAPVPTADS